MKDNEKSQVSQEKDKKEPLIVSARALLRKDFPEPKFIVQDMIPEGSLSILSARPKAGKTFLALQLVVSVALGKHFLLKRTEKTNVLFLSYELNQRQMKKRLSLVMKRLGVQPEQVLGWGFERFPLFFSFASRIKGVEGLKSLLEKYEEKTGKRFGLVIVDTYVLFKSDLDRKSGKTAYEMESEYLAELRKLCEEKMLSILLIYHNRKKQAISGDITEEVMGSTGITGAVNNLLFLERKTGEKEAHLKVTGHDIEEQVLELTFDNGIFKPRTLKDREREIVEFIISYLKQIGEANQSSIREYLKHKGYKSTHEIKDILDRYSQTTPNTPTYWYCFSRKRAGGGTSLKIYSLYPPPEISQDDLIESEKDDLQERKELIERVETLISEGVISSEFPETLEEYKVHDFKSLVKQAQHIPLDVLRAFVEKLESYRKEEEFTFLDDDDDNEYDFDF